MAVVFGTSSKGKVTVISNTLKSVIIISELRPGVAGSIKVCSAKLA